MLYFFKFTEVLWIAMKKEASTPIRPRQRRIMCFNSWASQFGKIKVRLIGHSDGCPGRSHLQAFEYWFGSCVCTKFWSIWSKIKIFFASGSVSHINFDSHISPTRTLTIGPTSVQANRKSGFKACSMFRGRFRTFERNNEWRWSSFHPSIPHFDSDADCSRVLNTF